MTHQTTATAVSLQPILKRLFDLTVASVLLVLLSPVLLLVAICVSLRQAAISRMQSAPIARAS